MNVKAIVFDGQLLETAVEGDNGRTLTVFRLMKQFWERVNKIEKTVKLDSIMNMTTMSKINDMNDILKYFHVERKTVGRYVELKSDV